MHDLLKTKAMRLIQEPLTGFSRLATCGYWALRSLALPFNHVNIIFMYTKGIADYILVRGKTNEKIH